MKNLLSLFLSATMLLGLAACSKSTSESSSNEKTTPNSIITYTANEKLPETTEQRTDGLHISAFNVKIINHTFSDGKGTITFDGDVINIGDIAFYRCDSLTSVTLPNSVTRIGHSAFMHCTSLAYVNLPTSVTSIEDWAFTGCTSLTSITLPNSVTSIGKLAFASCTSLKSVTLPNSVNCIGEYAFYDCPNDLIVRVPQESYDRFRRMIDSYVTVVGY